MLMMANYCVEYQWSTENAWYMWCFLEKVFCDILCQWDGGHLIRQIRKKRSLHLDGECIRWETSVRYLGNITCHPTTNCDDIPYKKLIYITSVQNLDCHFSFASTLTQAKSLQTYYSACYGSQHWQLDTEAVRGFYTELNRAVRRKFLANWMQMVYFYVSRYVG